MKVKNLLFFALFAAIYCSQSFCMELKNFDADQIHTLQVAMRQTPDSFDTLAQSLAHQMHSQNPAITLDELIEFFRVNDTEIKGFLFVTHEQLASLVSNHNAHETVLPREIIDQIWKFIQCERLAYVIEKSHHFIDTCCDNNLSHPLDQHHCSSRDNMPFPAAFAHDMQSSYLKNIYYHCAHWIHEHNGNNGYGRTMTIYYVSDLSGFHGRKFTPYIRHANFQKTGYLINSFTLLYGINTAILIITDGSIIAVIPKIPFVPGITTGRQLIDAIYNTNDCQQFTGWRQACEMLDHLDLSQY